MKVEKPGRKVYTKEDFPIADMVKEDYECSSCESIIKLEEDDFYPQPKSGFWGFWGFKDRPNVELQYQLWSYKQPGVWISFYCPLCGSRIQYRMQPKDISQYESLPEDPDVSILPA